MGTQQDGPPTSLEEGCHQKWNQPEPCSWTSGTVTEYISFVRPSSLWCLLRPPKQTDIPASPTNPEATALSGLSFF